MKHNEITDQLNKRIGRRIEDARVASGLSRYQLGDRLSISHQQVTKYETAENRVSASRLHHISMITEQDIWFFFSEENDYYTSENEHKRRNNRVFIDIISKLRVIDDFEVSKYVSKLLTSVLGAIDKK